MLTSSKGWYVASVADGTRERVFTLDDKNEEKNPRVSVLGWTPAGDALLVQLQRAESLGSRRDAPRPEDQAAHAARQGSQSLSEHPLLARRQHGRVSDVGRRSPGGSLRRRRQLPQSAQADDAQSVDGRARRCPSSELVAYRDADGKTLYGVLRYPVELPERAESIRRSSRSTRRSSTTASTAARRFSPITATPSSTRP